MKWVQLYLIVGLLVASDWDNHVEHVCPALDARGIYTLGAAIWPLIAVTEIFDGEPACKKTKQ